MVWKFKPGSFYADKFIHIEGEDGAGNFDNQIMNSGKKKKDKIAIEVVPTSQKPRPSIKIK